MTLTKIISGGQTGVDRGALDAALSRSFPCGGWCPTGRLAEDGRIDLKYPLEELPGGYKARTIQNIVDTDGTVVIYFGQLEGGTQLTVMQCMRRHKPYKLIDADVVSAACAAGLVADFIAAHNVETLNVAGPRQSKAPHAQTYAFDVVTQLLMRVEASVE
ncbi:MAG: putative molybdenum carrier protein [Planctomycetes bacterium]|nr:putative molybdenum carrier protein [Planctomycetota bacterium]